MFVFIKVCGEGIYIRLVSILLPNLLVSCGGDGGNEGHASLFMVTVLSPSPPLFFPPSSSLSLPPLVLSPFPSPPLSFPPFLSPSPFPPSSSQVKLDMHQNESYVVVTTLQEERAELLALKETLQKYIRQLEQSNDDLERGKR